MSQWLIQECSKVKDVVMAGIVAAAAALIFWTWIKFRSAAKVVGSMILAGGVTWGAANVDWFKAKVAQETGLGRPPAVSVVIVTAPRA